MEGKDMKVSIIERRILAATADIASGEARLVIALGSFDNANAAVSYGYDSTAAWLAWRCEMAPGTAREYVRIARALRALPSIAAALEHGRVGFARVRAITRIATAATQDEWLLLAGAHSAAELEAIVRDRRAAAMVADPSLQAEHRRLRTRWTSSGMLGVEALLPAVDGAILDRALAAAAADTAVSEETDQDLNGAPLPDRKRADALVAMARAYLAGNRGAAPESERYAVLIHLDGMTGEARLHDGPTLPSETFAPLLSSAKIFLADREGRLAPAPRRLSRAMRRAILFGRPECGYPGCHNSVHVDIHHKIQQARGGSHGKENLVPLCSAHHRAVHRLGLTLSYDEGGRIQAHTPDGTLINELPNPLRAEEGERVAS
jgi:uncharacterized protein DUF222/HNH endonuclease